MEQEQTSQVDWLLLLSRSIKFATDHPYAATGIFGAAVGSAVTYKALTMNGIRQRANKVFTPKVYQFEIQAEDLRRMLADPTYELRWELTTDSVIITSEKRETPKALPDIKAEEE
jgi:hypothetical protein